MGLGINLPSLIAQLVNFGLLLLLLYFLLYKPILRMLDQRSAKIKESMQKAEEIKERAAKAEEEVKAQLDAARKEGQALVTQARQIGERVKEEARVEARKETESLLARAQDEGRRERDEAVQELRKEFADLAILAAQKVINQSLDKQAHQRLIQEVLEESSTLKKS